MASKKIGACWIRKTKDGKVYMSGVIDLLGEDIQIAVFKNDKKEKDNQPDYNIVRSGQQKERSANPDALSFLDVGGPSAGGMPPLDEPLASVNLDDIDFGK
jgi:uncharacterized protein (DUF736 family)